MARLTLTGIVNSGLLRVATGATLTFGLLAWALRDTSPTIIWNGMQGVKYDWLFLAVVALLVSFSFRARRWGTLLGAWGVRADFETRHSAIFIGSAGNCVLPGHVGEIARAIVISRCAGVPFAAALGSIFAERFLDVIAVCVFLMVPFIWGTAPRIGQTDLSYVALTAIATLLVIVTGMVIIATQWPKGILRLADITTRKFGMERLSGRIASNLQTFLNGLIAFRRPRIASIAFMETLLIWYLTGFTYWFGMLAFGIISPGMSGALFVQSVATLGVMIPSSPGYFGAFEAAVRIALEGYVAPVNVVMAYAIVMHIVIYATVTGIGCFLAIRLGLSWRDIVRPGAARPQSSVVGASKEHGKEATQVSGVL